MSVRRPCFVRVLSTVCCVMLCLSGDYASCGSCQQCVMYCCVCLVIMLRVGLVDSVLCNVVSVWRPCFVRVLSTVSCIVVSVWRSCFVLVLSIVCHVMLCLSGDHALCESCQQCIMYYCVCLATMLCVGLIDSVSCNVVSVWRPCFVRVLSTVCHVLLCVSGNHALCGSC